jgi:hypothetical protein
MMTVTTMLLKLSAANPQSSLPPIESLAILGATLTSIDKTKKTFSDVFKPFFKDVPNLMVVCRESSKPMFAALSVCYHCHYYHY